MLHLTPPKPLTLIISVALASIAATVHYTHVPIPYTHSGFTILFVSYAVLFVSNLLEEL